MRVFGGFLVFSLNQLILKVYENSHMTHSARQRHLLMIYSIPTGQFQNQRIRRVMGAKSVSNLADWQSKPIKVPGCVLFAHKSMSHGSDRRHGMHSYFDGG